MSQQFKRKRIWITIIAIASICIVATYASLSFFRNDNTEIQLATSVDFEKELKNRGYKVIEINPSDYYLGYSQSVIPIELSSEEFLEIASSDYSFKVVLKQHTRRPPSNTQPVIMYYLTHNNYLFYVIFQE